ncbi:MAG: sugar ABC transporter substrate-binding protein [Oscillospiraceae bacterium]
MKKLLALLLALTMVLAFVGCKSGETPAPKEEDKVLIGLSMHNQTADWAVQFKDTFLAKAAEKGVEVTWNDANATAATQVANIEDLVAQGIDVLVVVPADYSALGQALKAASDAGVKIVNADSKVADADQALVSCFVTADCYTGGRTCGEYLAKVFPDGATIGGLNYPQIAVIADRFVGMQDAWNDLKRDDLKLIDKTCTDLNAIATYTEDMLMSNPEIAGFVCLNDNTALSCYAACVQLGRPDCVVVGFDGSPAAKQSISNKEMTATMVYSPVDLATFSFDAANELATGGTPEKEVQVPMWIINPENITERDLEGWE